MLDTPKEARSRYLDPGLAAFPYVNGSLFSGPVEIPQFTEDLRTALLEKASLGFDWAEISPTIFGAVFESTLNPETRRSGGMHYTSIENIHKVIDPLFLDALRTELNGILEIPLPRQRNARLRAYQDKLASLTFLDPACGSGNFLTETYLSLRRLENEAIATLIGPQSLLDLEGGEIRVKVSIAQFHGIEINDFAVSVAKTALWIAESQMLAQTSGLLHRDLDFLPLKTYANIREGNALRMDWGEGFDYIIGNPPFVGHQHRLPEQVEDFDLVCRDIHNHGKLDYVCAWYVKAAALMKGTRTKAAFVSTNSISQGEPVAILWKPLFEQGLTIHFAVPNFQWESESTDAATVHCDIIGFSMFDSPGPKWLYFGSSQKKPATHINGYLLDAPDVYIQARGQMLTPGLPAMTKGSQPTDGGNLFLTPAEKDELLARYPSAATFVKRFMGADEFINNRHRYCLWLKGVEPSAYRNIPPVMERLAIIAEMRRNSPTASVRRDAETPMLFTQIRQPTSNYILIPSHSSEKRRYIPMGFMSPDVICGNANMMIPDADIYLFGILVSNVHMAWMRVVCGRLEMRYRYSPAVYNNFPWPSPTEAVRSRIAQTAQGILDARAAHPSSSLADLYDELAMPPDLRAAHRANDRAVMSAYGFDVKMTEGDCVAALFKLYERLATCA